MPDRIGAAHPTQRIDPSGAAQRPTKETLVPVRQRSFAVKHPEDFSATQIEDALNAVSKSTAQKRLDVDLERFQHHLDDPSISAERRDEFLSALWFIVSTFVELGFDVHPLQQACGKGQNALDCSGNSESDGVGSKEYTDINEQNDAPRF